MIKEESMTGFYYIGSERHHIAKLVRMYKRGYASDSFQHAITELTREKHFQPEVICCESRFGLAAITQFSKFLSRHASLSRIPFIIDGEMMSAEDHQLCVRNNLADDILSLGTCDEVTLGRKIRFFQKIKLKAPELEKQEQVADSGQTQPSLYNFLKRGFDMMVALAALILLAPLFLLIAVIVRLESKGPVFYISKRAGKGYRIFNFYKFRTMFNGAENHMEELAHLNQYQGKQEPLFFKINNDPRITRIGGFLRNSSLDELPQLINVLLGDMSLVGNRPLPLYEAATLTTDDLAKRFLAPAGITGLWQIKKRGNEEMSVEERISLDIDYANHSNFLYDLWIMANTPQALIQKANA
jgi:lipopolysaccharide/colanic/teichoic acid biosynthesis glycosyltransferase